MVVIYIILALIGWRIGGFFGAVVLCSIAYYVQQYKDLLLEKLVGSSYVSAKTVGHFFVHTTFAVMGYLSKTKGRVNEIDIAWACHMMRQFGLDAAGESQAQQAFRAGKAEGFDFEGSVATLYQRTAKRDDLRALFLRIQVQTAMNDKRLERVEHELLHKIARALHFSADELAQMLAEYARHEGQAQGESGADSGAKHGLDEAYSTLGVVVGADQATVRMAYRRMMNQYHPDKISAKGLPADFVVLAKEKSQQIQAAYETIKQANGWK